MRLLPGYSPQFANETITSRHLMQHVISEPAILNNLATLFRGKFTPFSSLLADKKLTQNNLFAGMETKQYKVVGNTKIMWPIKHFKKRKGHILDYECREYSATPGKNQTIVILYLDTNWFSPYDVLELCDNRTMVTVVDDQLPEEVTTGKWKYIVKLNTRDKDAFINPTLLTVNSEIGFAYTNFYEMSETAYEKYTFDGWGTSHMTLQRMKWSISGTAAAMETSKHWMVHNKQITFVTHSEMEMLERWAEARETQLLFGRGTVTENDEVLLKDIKNREILAGDGLLNQGDGALKFQHNGITLPFLQNIMKNMQLYSDNTGVVELVLLGGQELIWQFTELMQKTLNVNPVTMVEGTGSNKGINADVSFYQYGGVKFYPIWMKYFDDPSRPQFINSDGTRNESNRGIFASLGNINTGENNIELVALKGRQFLKGTVSGINNPDANGRIPNSVDGEHHHVLSQTGIVCRDPYSVAEIYKPIKR